MSKGDKAIAIKVNERYFMGFGKNGRLQTGWSLSVAKLFADWKQAEIKAVETKLGKKGYKPVRVTVRCETEPKYTPVGGGPVDYTEAWQGINELRNKGITQFGKCPCCGHYCDWYNHILNPHDETNECPKCGEVFHVSEIEFDSDLEPEPVRAVCYSAQDVGVEVEKPCAEFVGKVRMGGKLLPVIGNEIVTVKELKARGWPVNGNGENYHDMTLDLEEIPF